MKGKITLITLKIFTPPFMGTDMLISSGLLLYIGTVYMLGKESLGIITP